MLQGQHQCAKTLGRSHGEKKAIRKFDETAVSELELAFEMCV